jgi:hypothetical protein
MAFSADLDDAVSRVRFALGDSADPPQLPGGETAYEALLAAAGYDLTRPGTVVQAAELIAVRPAASALAAHYASQPDSISDGGSSLSWRARVSHLTAIADGTITPAILMSPTTPAKPGATAPRSGVIRVGTDWQVR